MLAHNHRSGVAEPSQADELIARRLKKRWDSSMCAFSIILSSAERSLNPSRSAGCYSSPEQNGAPEERNFEVLSSRRQPSNVASQICPATTPLGARAYVPAQRARIP